MPSYLINGHHDEPVLIPGTDGATVTFKSQATYGDDLHCDAVAVQFKPPPKANLSEAQRIDLEAQRVRAVVLARTALMVADWSLVDVEGRPLPITPESVASLSKPVGLFIVQEARKRFEGEGDIPFARGSSEPSSEEEPAEIPA